MNSQPNLISKLQIIIPFIWFGIVLGISFLEAPVKFTTPSLTREVALDVGQTVFQALNYLEWTLAFLLGTLILLKGKIHLNRSSRILFGLVFTLLFIQSFWLIPELKSRAALIIGGQEPPKSFIHLSYVILEFLKLSLLFSLGYRDLSR